MFSSGSKESDVMVRIATVALLSIVMVFVSAAGTQAAVSNVTSLTGYHSTAGVAFSLDGSRAFVVEDNDGVPGGIADVIVFDARTLEPISGRISAGIPGAGVNHAIAMSPDGSKAYVSLGQGKIKPFSPSTLTFGTAITVGTAGVGQVVFSPDGTTAYVAVTNNGSGTQVKVIDVLTDSVTLSVTACTGPDGLALTPDGQKLFVNCSDGSIAVIETVGNTVIHTFTPGGHLQGTTITMAPDGASVYATSFTAPSTVTSVIDTTSYAVEHQFTDEPKDVAFTVDGLIAYYISASLGDLVPTDPTTFSSGTPIDVTGPSPGLWFLMNRNPVADQFWITGGSTIYVAGELPRLADTGLDDRTSWTVLVAAVSVVSAGLLMVTVRRRGTRSSAR